MEHGIVPMSDLRQRKTIAPTSGMCQEPMMEQSRIPNALSRAPFMEHRWGRRLPCHARVKITGRMGLEGRGRLRDISSSGAFVETPIAIPVHSRIALTVIGHGEADRPVDTLAIVVRAESGGVGIEWCETPTVTICTVVGCTSRCDARD